MALGVTVNTKMSSSGQILDHPGDATTTRDHPVIDDDDEDDSDVLDKCFHHQSVNTAINSNDMPLDKVSPSQRQRTTIKIEGCSDVVIGTVTNCHKYSGPVTTVQQSQNGAGRLVKSDTVDVNIEHKTISRYAVARHVILTAALLVVLLVVSVVTWATVTKSEPIVTGPTYEVTPPTIVNTSQGNFVIVDKSDPILTDSTTNRTAAVQTRSGNFVPRQEWGGASPQMIKQMYHPTPWVIFTYPVTRMSKCDGFENCRKQLLNFEASWVKHSQTPDVPCNFYIGGSDSLIFEGLGWDVSASIRSNTVVVCCIGKSVFDCQNKDLMGAFESLLEWGVMQGKVDKKYQLTCHYEVVTAEKKIGGHKCNDLSKYYEHYPDSNTTSKVKYIMHNT